MFLCLLHNSLASRVVLPVKIHYVIYCKDKCCMRHAIVFEMIKIVVLLHEINNLSIYWYKQERKL